MKTFSEYLTESENKVVDEWFDALKANGWKVYGQSLSKGIKNMKTAGDLNPTGSVTVDIEVKGRQIAATYDNKVLAMVDPRYNSPEKGLKKFEDDIVKVLKTRLK